MSKRTILTMILLAALLVPMITAAAQGGDGQDIPDSEDNVYVTTQDFTSFRTGPGQYFERTAVIGPVVTLRAVGRSADTRWVQVEYNGQTGWAALRLLVWSGDLLALPVDGVAVETSPATIRRAGVVGMTSRETPLYRSEVHPDDQIGTLPPGTPVEVTGRLGSRGFYRLQIRHEGQLYWVGSWNVRITDGSPFSVLDNAYIYPYGRLVLQLNRDIDSAFMTLNQIEGYWRRLRSGEQVSCRYIPNFARRRVTDNDVNKEPVFAPLVTALDGGLARVNAAVAAFEDACSRAGEEGYYLTLEQVDAALADVDEARRGLNLARSLWNALQVRDPLLTE